jgi:hypothetical protein
VCTSSRVWGVAGPTCAKADHYSHQQCSRFVFVSLASQQVKLRQLMACTRKQISMGANSFSENEKECPRHFFTFS